MVKVWPTSGSLIVAAAKGVIVSLSSTACPAMKPPITGASLIEVETTVVVSLTVSVVPSLTVMVKVVVSVVPGATRFSVGSKTRA